MSAVFTVPVTLVTRTVTGQDADGNDAFSTVNTTVQGVFAPGGSVEATRSGDTVATQPTVYLPSPAPSVIDGVVVLGIAFEVDGEPADWSVQPNPFGGWTPDLPVVVRLKRVTG